MRLRTGYHQVPSTSRSTSQLRSLGSERDGKLIHLVPRGSTTSFMKWVEGMSSALIVRSERGSRQGLDRKVVCCYLSLSLSFSLLCVFGELPFTSSCVPWLYVCCMVDED